MFEAKLFFHLPHQEKIRGTQEERTRQHGEALHNKKNGHVQRKQLAQPPETGDSWIYTPMENPYIIGSFSSPRIPSLFEHPAKYHTWLVVEPTHLKNISQIGFIFPNFRGENKKNYLKPPPRHVRERGTSLDRSLGSAACSPPRLHQNCCTTSVTTQ